MSRRSTARHDGLQRLYHDHAYDPRRPVGTWWEAGAGAGAAVPRRPVEGDLQADVAVVGGGYTGLSTALHLAREHGRAPLVIDAGRIGWGASGRNAGFCCVGAAKLSSAAIARRHGDAELVRFYGAQRRAVELVAALLEEHAIDADVQPGGEYYMAHRERDFRGFGAAAAEYERLLGGRCERIGEGELRAAGLAGPTFRGALHLPVGFGLNPRRYVLGLADAVERAGGTIRIDSPVSGAIERADGRYELTTPAGRVVADQLVLAANGYNSENVPPWMRGRYLPVLSHVMVTEPIAPDLLEAQGWSTTHLACDTRRLLHYFRLLPDRRFLIGMRGAADVDPASARAMPAALRADFERMFPAWAAVPSAHHWSGLVCLSRALTPYVGRLGSWRRAWTALAYHGSGVAMGTYAGRLLAGMVAGVASDEPLPAAMAGPLRAFPVPAWRRRLLPLAFGYQGLRDR